MFFRLHAPPNCYFSKGSSVSLLLGRFRLRCGDLGGGEWRCSLCSLVIHCSCRLRLVVEWLLTVSSTRCKWKPFEKEALLIFWQICRRRSLVEIKKCYTSDTFLFIIYGRKFRFSRISYVLREVPSATSTDSLWKEWHYKLIHYKLLISLLC